MVLSVRDEGPRVSNRDLRRRRFDAVLDLQGLLRSASLAWACGCKHRFGPDWGREFAHWFYTTTVPRHADWVHVIDYYMKIIEAMGGCDRGVEFVLPEKPAVAASVRDLLHRSLKCEVSSVKPQAKADAVEGKTSDFKLQTSNFKLPYAVIIPGSAQVSKCWPAERFGALADRLASEHGLSIVATGGGAENAMIERYQGMRRRIVNLPAAPRCPSWSRCYARRGSWSATTRGRATSPPHWASRWG